MIRAFLSLAALAFAIAGAIYQVDPGAFADLGAVGDWFTAIAGSVGLAACAPGAGLAGALANAAQGCAADTGGREWILADRIDASRLGLGSQVTIRLGSIPNRDPLGRFAHVRGIYWSAKAAIVVGAATNDAVTAYQIRGCYQAMFLADVTGWAYFDAIDGRDVMDDAWFRHWSNQQWPYTTVGAEGGPMGPLVNTDFGVGKDVGAATYVVEGSLYLPLVSNADGASPLEGLIPLAALQARGDSALRFNVAAAAGIPGNPANVTFGGFRNPDPALQANTGMECWLDVVYLDNVVVDAPWQIETYQIAEAAGVLRHRDRITEYAAIRYHNDDAPQGAATAGQRAVESIAGVTLVVAGFVKVAAYTLDQMVRRAMLFERTIPDSALSEDCAERDLPLVTRNAGLNTYQTFAMLLLAQRQRATAAAGAVNFTYATDPCSFVRYLHRTTACITTSRVNDITATTQCNPVLCASPSGMTPNNAYQPVIVIDKANAPAK